MKVTCVQMAMQFASPDENFQKAESLIRRAAAEGPDVIVLPETWNTGFFPHDNLPACCDADGERTTRLMAALSAELGVNIVAGSVVNRKAGGIYNTATAQYYGNISPKVKDVQPGYQWYVFSAKWPPHSTDYIWMGPPRFFNSRTPVEAVYLDRIEIIENK